MRFRDPVVLLPELSRSALASVAHPH
jgi:hypothetical protein